MFIKKVAPFAAVALAGALMLTGCTSASNETEKSASSSSTEGEAGAISSEQQQLVDAFKASEEKMMKDGYTQTATDGTASILIAYDPATNRTVTSDASTGTATYVESALGTAPQTLGSFLQNQAVSVKKNGDKYDITLPDSPDASLTVTVKDGVVVGITSKAKDSPTWEGKLVYEVTADAKAAFAKATPAETAPPVEAPAPEGEAPPAE